MDLTPADAEVQTVGAATDGVAPARGVAGPDEHGLE